MKNDRELLQVLKKMRKRLPPYLPVEKVDKRIQELEEKLKK